MVHSIDSVRRQLTTCGGLQDVAEKLFEDAKAVDLVKKQGKTALATQLSGYT